MRDFAATHDGLKELTLCGGQFYRRGRAGHLKKCILSNSFRAMGTSQNFEPITLITASGPGVKPGIDLDNSRSLLDIMDDPS